MTSDTKYCTHCGGEVSTEAAFCEHCGEPIEKPSVGGNGHPRKRATNQLGAEKDERRPQGSSDDIGTAQRRDTRTPNELNRSPGWLLAVMGACWLLFIIGLWPGTATGRTIAGLAVLVSLPVIWIDARKAKAAGEIKVSHPILVVLAILLLWLLTLPAYILYRYLNRGK